MTITLFGKKVESIKRQSAKGSRQTPITNSQLLVEAGRHYSVGSDVFAMWDKIYDGDKIKENTISGSRYFASEDSDNLLFQKKNSSSILSYDIDDPYSMSTLRSQSAIYAALDEMDGDLDGIIRHKNHSVFNITEEEFVKNNYSVKLENNGFEIVGLNNGHYDSTITTSSPTTTSSSTTDQLKDLETRLGGNTDISLGTLQKLYNGSSSADKAEVEKEILAVTGYKDMNQFNKVVEYASTYAQSHNNDWSNFEADLAAHCKSLGFDSRPSGSLYTSLMNEAQNKANGCISHDQINKMA